MDAPKHVFSGNPLDRVARLRTDEAWLAARLEDPASRFLPVWRLNVLVKKSEPRLAWARAALCASMDKEVGAVLLGLAGEVAHFAVDLSGLADPGHELGLAAVAEFQDARAAAMALPAEDAAMVAQARSLVDWHATHRFCPGCGRTTESRQGGGLRVCTGCGAEHFPRVNPVAIMLVTRGDRCLLGRQSAWPAGMYSALAGFIEPGESIEEAVRREVAEEAGVRVGRVRYHSSQPWPFPSSLMIGCTAEAESEAVTIDDAEIEDARWFDRAELARAAAGESSELMLPPPLAIARCLVDAWLADV